MKTTKFLTPFIILLFTAAFQFDASAQHCPFDGTRMIVVHLTDAKNNPVTDAVQSLVLREIDNPNADSCTYAEGLLNKPFLLANDAFSNIYNNSYDLIREYCADCAFLTDGFYAVRLGQAETSCMIKKDGSFEYSKRKFEIDFEKNAVQQTAEVPAGRIYSLCTGGGSWSRIIPIEIKIPE